MKDIKDRVLRAMLCMTRQCWEQGIAAQALLECGEWELLDLVVHDMVLRQSSDGRLCNVEDTPAVTDSAFCIPAVLASGQRFGRREYLEAAEKNVRFLLSDAERAEDGTLCHMLHTQEIWADSAAFLPYSLALSGHPEEAFVQLRGILGRLFCEETGLYLHMWDEKSRRFLRPLAWGVGNGWILTGLLRTLGVWPEGYPAERAWMEERFHALLERMLDYETETHGFHDILDDADTFEESETAAMTAYVLYRGVKEGILGKTYIPRAEEIREALLKKIGPDGLAADASSSPDFDRPGTSVECQAHILMMEEARSHVRNS